MSIVPTLLLSRPHRRDVRQDVDARLRWDGDGAIVEVGTRRFEIRSDSAGVSRHALADFALYGLAGLSMTHNLAIHLDAEVSGSALDRLDRMSAIWMTWIHADAYPLALTATSVVDDGGPPRGSGGVMAFSGGIDSAYAALDAAADGYTHAMLIDGMAQVHEKAGAFALQRERVARQTGMLGLDLVTVRTDYGRLRADVALFHTYMLAMALHFAGRDRAYGGFAADNPLFMDLERHPWGNNPVVAAHLGSARFPVRHRGADACRTEKLTAIARRLPGLLPLLTVCSGGDEPGRNCGRCDKCVRTRLGFLAAGVDASGVFVHAPDPAAHILALSGRQLPRAEIRAHRFRLAEIELFLPDGREREAVREAMARLRDRHDRRNGFRRKRTREPAFAT